MDGSALLPALAADPAEARARERKESGKMAFLGDGFALLLVSNKHGLGAVMGVFGGEFAPPLPAALPGVPSIKQPWAESALQLSPAKRPRLQP